MAWPADLTGWTRDRLAASDPDNAEWQRDLWLSLWKLAAMRHGAVTWHDVRAAMEAMAAKGTLLPADRPLLNQARASAP